MKLREISINAYYGYEKQKEFNTQVWCVKEMYWVRLKNVNTKSLAKFVIRLGENLPKTKYGNVLITYQAFDFDRYFNLKTTDRKRLILDLLHNGLLEIAKSEDIDENLLIDAYHYCLEKNLEHKWLFKNKYLISPKKDFYGAVECYWGTDKFTATGIILNKQKTELLRKVLVEVEPYFGESIYWSKIGWDNVSFYFEFEKNQKFTLSVAGL